MKTHTLTALSFLALIGTASAQTPVGTSGSTATASTSTATSVAAATAADYRLTAGDKLRIEVYKDAQLSQSLQVRPDGKITLPLVGDARVRTAGTARIAKPWRRAG